MDHAVRIIRLNAAPESLSKVNPKTKGISPYEFIRINDIPFYAGNAASSLFVFLIYRWLNLVKFDLTCIKFVITALLP